MKITTISNIQIVVGQDEDGKWHYHTGLDWSPTPFVFASEAKLWAARSLPSFFVEANLSAVKKLINGTHLMRKFYFKKGTRKTFAFDNYVNYAELKAIDKFGKMQLSEKDSKAPIVLIDVELAKPRKRPTKTCL